MKKILNILLLSGIFLSANAQQVKRLGENSTTNSVSAQLLNAVNSCQELNQQLSSMFGRQYSLDNPQVMAQLEKNIKDVEASACIRKVSLYVKYGNDYSKHLNEISNNITK